MKSQKNQRTTRMMVYFIYFLLIGSTFNVGAVNAENNTNSQDNNGIIKTLTDLLKKLFTKEKDVSYSPTSFYFGTTPSTNPTTTNRFGTAPSTPSTTVTTPSTNPTTTPFFGASTESTNAHTEIISGDCEMIESEWNNDHIIQGQPAEYNIKGSPGCLGQMISYEVVNEAEIIINQGSIIFTEEVPGQGLAKIIVNTELLPLETGLYVRLSTTINPLFIFDSRTSINGIIRVVNEEIIGGTGPRDNPILGTINPSKQTYFLIDFGRRITQEELSMIKVYDLEGNNIEKEAYYLPESRTVLLIANEVLEQFNIDYSGIIGTKTLVSDNNLDGKISNDEIPVIITPAGTMITISSVESLNEEISVELIEESGKIISLNSRITPKGQLSVLINEEINGGFNINLRGINQGNPNALINVEVTLNGASLINTIMGEKTDNSSVIGGYEDKVYCSQGDGTSTNSPLMCVDDCSEGTECITQGCFCAVTLGDENQTEDCQVCPSGCRELVQGGGAAGEGGGSTGGSEGEELDIQQSDFCKNYPKHPKCSGSPKSTIGNTGITESDLKIPASGTNQEFDKIQNDLKKSGMGNMLLGEGINDAQSNTQVASHVLITEIAYSGAEFIEIHNPTSNDIILENYYLTNTPESKGNHYYDITRGLINPKDYITGEFGGFYARFPKESIIKSGETQVITLVSDKEFTNTYGVTPSYHMIPKESKNNMRTIFPGSTGSFTDPPTITNLEDSIYLFYWDGKSDLVTDKDIIYLGGLGESFDKTGIGIDGPDPGNEVTTYQGESDIKERQAITGYPESTELFNEVISVTNDIIETKQMLGNSEKQPAYQDQMRMILGNEQSEVKMEIPYNILGEESSIVIGKDTITATTGYDGGIKTIQRVGPIEVNEMTQKNLRIITQSSQTSEGNTGSINYISSNVIDGQGFDSSTSSGCLGDTKKSLTFNEVSNSDNAFGVGARESIQKMLESSNAQGTGVSERMIKEANVNVLETSDNFNPSPPIITPGEANSLDINFGESNIMALSEQKTSGLQQRVDLCLSENSKLTLGQSSIGINLKTITPTKNTQSINTEHDETSESLGQSFTLYQPTPGRVSQYFSQEAKKQGFGNKGIYNSLGINKLGDIGTAIIGKENFLGNTYSGITGSFSTLNTEEFYNLPQEAALGKGRSSMPDYSAIEDLNKRTREYQAMYNYYYETAYNIKDVIKQFNSLLVEEQNGIREEYDENGVKMKEGFEKMDNLMNPYRSSLYSERAILNSLYNPQDAESLAYRAFASWNQGSIVITEEFLDDERNFDINKFIENPKAKELGLTIGEFLDDEGNFDINKLIENPKVPEGVFYKKLGSIAIAGEFLDDERNFDINKVLENPNVPKGAFYKKLNSMNKNQNSINLQGEMKQDLKDILYGNKNEIYTNANNMNTYYQKLAEENPDDENIAQMVKYWDGIVSELKDSNNWQQTMKNAIKGYGASIGLLQGEVQKSWNDKDFRTDFFEEHKATGQNDLSNKKELSDDMANSGQLSVDDKKKVDDLLKEAQKWADQIGKGNEWALNEMLKALAAAQKILGEAAKDGVGDAGGKTNAGAGGAKGAIAGAKKGVLAGVLANKEQILYCKQSEGDECKNYLCPIQDAGGDADNPIIGGDDMLAHPDNNPEGVLALIAPLFGFVNTLTSSLTGKVIGGNNEVNTQPSFDVKVNTGLKNGPKPITPPAYKPKKGSNEGTLGQIPLNVNNNKNLGEELSSQPEINQPEGDLDKGSNEAGIGEKEINAKKELLEKEEAKLLESKGLEKRDAEITNNGKKVFFDEKGAYTYDKEPFTGDIDPESTRKVEELGKLSQEEVNKYNEAIDSLKKAGIKITESLEGFTWNGEVVSFSREPGKITIISPGSPLEGLSLPLVKAEADVLTYFTRQLNDAGKKIGELRKEIEKELLSSLIKAGVEEPEIKYDSDKGIIYTGKIEGITGVELQYGTDKETGKKVFFNYGERIYLEGNKEYNRLKELAKEKENPEEALAYMQLAFKALEEVNAGIEIKGGGYYVKGTDNQVFVSELFDGLIFSVEDKEKVKELKDKMLSGEIKVEEYGYLPQELIEKNGIKVYGSLNDNELKDYQNIIEGLEKVGTERYINVRKVQIDEYKEKLKLLGYNERINEVSDDAKKIMDEIVKIELEIFILREKFEQRYGQSMQAKFDKEIERIRQKYQGLIGGKYLLKFSTMSYEEIISEIFPEGTAKKISDNYEKSESYRELAEYIFEKETERLIDYVLAVEGSKEHYISFETSYNTGEIIIFYSPEVISALENERDKALSEAKTETQKEIIIKKFNEKIEEIKNNNDNAEEIINKALKKITEEVETEKDRLGQKIIDTKYELFEVLKSLGITSLDDVYLRRISELSEGDIGEVSTMDAREALDLYRQYLNEVEEYRQAYSQIKVYEFRAELTKKLVGKNNKEMIKILDSELLGFGDLFKDFVIEIQKQTINDKDLYEFNEGFSGALAKHYYIKEETNKFNYAIMEYARITKDYGGSLLQVTDTYRGAWAVKVNELMDKLVPEGISETFYKIVKGGYTKGTDLNSRGEYLAHYLGTDEYYEHMLETEFEKTFYNMRRAVSFAVQINNYPEKSPSTIESEILGMEVDETLRNLENAGKAGLLTIGNKQFETGSADSEAYYGTFNRASELFKELQKKLRTRQTNNAYLTTEKYVERAADTATELAKKLEQNLKGKIDRIVFETPGYGEEVYYGDEGIKLLETAALTKTKISIVFTKGVKTESKESYDEVSSVEKMIGTINSIQEVLKETSDDAIAEVRSRFSLASMVIKLKVGINDFVYDNHLENGRGFTKEVLGIVTTGIINSVKVYIEKTWSPSGWYEERGDNVALANYLEHYSKSGMNGLSEEAKTMLGEKVPGWKEYNLYGTMSDEEYVKNLLKWEIDPSFESLKFFDKGFLASAGDYLTTPLTLVEFMGISKAINLVIGWFRYVGETVAIKYTSFVASRQIALEFSTTTFSRTMNYLSYNSLNAVRTGGGILGEGVSSVFNSIINPYVISNKLNVVLAPYIGKGASVFLTEIVFEEFFLASGADFFLGSGMGNAVDGLEVGTGLVSGKGKLRIAAMIGEAVNIYSQQMIYTEDGFNELIRVPRGDLPKVLEALGGVTQTGTIKNPDNGRIEGLRIGVEGSKATIVELDSATDIEMTKRAIRFHQIGENDWGFTFINEKAIVTTSDNKYNLFYSELKNYDLTGVMKLEVLLKDLKVRITKEGMLITDLVTKTKEGIISEHLTFAGASTSEVTAKLQSADINSEVTNPTEGVIKIVNKETGEVTFLTTPEVELSPGKSSPLGIEIFMKTKPQNRAVSELKFGDKKFGKPQVIVLQIETEIELKQLKERMGKQGELQFLEGNTVFDNEGNIVDSVIVTNGVTIVIYTKPGVVIDYIQDKGAYRKSVVTETVVPDYNLLISLSLSNGLIKGALTEEQREIVKTVLITELLEGGTEESQTLTSLLAGEIKNNMLPGTKINDPLQKLALLSDNPQGKLLLQNIISKVKGNKYVKADALIQFANQIEVRNVQVSNKATIEISPVINSPGTAVIVSEIGANQAGTIKIGMNIEGEIYVTGTTIVSIRQGGSIMFVKVGVGVVTSSVENFVESINQQTGEGNELNTEFFTDEDFKEIEALMAEMEECTPAGVSGAVISIDKGITGATIACPRINTKAFNLNSGTNVRLQGGEEITFEKVTGDEIVAELMQRPMGSGVQAQKGESFAELIERLGNSGPLTTEEEGQKLFYELLMKDAHISETSTIETNPNEKITENSDEKIAEVTISGDGAGIMTITTESGDEIIIQLGTDAYNSGGSGDGFDAFMKGLFDSAGISIEQSGPANVEKLTGGMTTQILLCKK